MWKFLEDKIQEEVQKAAADGIQGIIKELDPDRFYIVWVPLSVDVDELSLALKPFQGHVNIAVIQSENFRILEM